MHPGPHPPKYFFSMAKVFIELRVILLVQLFVAVPTMPWGTLGGVYRRTYAHLHAWYRG
jgi:hypothetical protein